MRRGLVLLLLSVMACQSEPAGQGAASAAANDATATSAERAAASTEQAATSTEQAATSTEQAATSTEQAAALTATSERSTNGQVVTQGIPGLDPQVMADLQRYRGARSALFAGFAPRGVLVKTRFGQTDQVHLVNAPGARRTQLTFHPEPIGEVATPNDDAVRGFLFTKDVGGSEFYQLFWFDWQSGAQRMLSDGESRYVAPRFAPDGDRFAYTSTERDGVHFDIYVRTPTTQPRRVVTSEGSAYWLPLDFSPDGNRLLALRFISANQTYLYEVDLASTEKRLLAGADNATFIGPAVYAADGQSVYYTSDADSEVIRLRYLDAKGDRVLTGTIDWGVEHLSRSADGARIAFSVNEEGYSQLYLLDTRSQTPRRIDAVPAGIFEHLEFDARGERLALTISQPTEPTDVYVYDVGAAASSRWTFSEVGGLDTGRFPQPRLIRYPSFVEEDGTRLDIPAFVFTPEGPGPHPVVVVIHGGPAAQYRPRFSANIQYYVNEMGIAVIAPNVRGSAGYGKTYLKLDDGFLREDSVKDIGALFDWIDTQPQFDSERVAVYGGSYGGYMVLASMVNFPQRIAAGIDVVGISNFVTFLENTQAYRRDLRRVEYGDERDPEMRAFLERIAPLNRVDQLQAPLLVAQGYNDPRVPASESEQIVAALEARDIPAWYLLFLDEGHGFRKKANADLAAAIYAQFLRTHLLP